MKNEKNKLVMDFICEMIAFYKELVFEQKEFVISKRILKTIMESGACYSNKRNKETFENIIETEFWLKVLDAMFMRNIENEENVKILETVENLIEKSEKIISFMEKSL